MTNTTCAACGTPQAQGAAWCAVCGTAFPRQGTPAAAPVTASPVPAASSVPVHTGTTEPERIGATVRGYTPPAPAPAPVPVGAHPGRRFAAWVIDSVALGIIPGVILAAGLLASGVPLGGGVVRATAEEAQEILRTLMATYVGAAAAAIACWIALVAVEGRTGRTLAGLLLGLRTVDADSLGPIGFWRSALRWFLIGASSIALGVGQILMVLSPAFDSSPRKQGWHDKAARSVVLRGAGSRTAATFGPAQAGVFPASVPTASPVPATAPVPAPVSAPASGPAPAAPDPWAFPSPAPAASAVPSGLITGIPGGAAPSTPATPPAALRAAPPAPLAHNPVAPAPVVPTPAPSAPVAAGANPVAPAPTVPGDDVDGETRMTPARPRVLVLELATGERQAVTGRTLLGRNPQAPAGEPWDVITVPDPTRSVSKTHAELHPDQGGLWVVDRGSTNGTVVSVPGRAPQVAEAGARVRVTAGATVHLGDARVLIRSDAP